VQSDALLHPAHRKKAGHHQADWLAYIRRTYTTMLHANGEDVKVVQELLRHGSAKITMDVYAQAVTPAKRKAQEKVVAMLRDTKKEEQTS
jgi:integrase